jgi:ribonucleotide reductase alpha subunit
MKAKDLWKKMLAMLFETGHPWITFKDPCNARYTNQHVGVVNSSNLCLTGDTNINCIVNGNLVENLKLEEAVELFNNGAKLQVLSYDTKSKIYEYCDITAAALINKSAEILQIEDEGSGKYIRCTPEHKIYTTNRGYVMAKELSANDKIIFS